MTNERSGNVSLTIFVCLLILAVIIQLILQKRPRRKKLDPSMIGAPSNFVHLNHIGSGEPTGAEVVYLLNIHLYFQIASC